MIFPPLLRDSSGNIIPQIWDGANWQPYKGQVEGLEALTLLIEGLSQTDYATDAKLEAVRNLVEAISQKDFATETTLVKVLNKLSADPATATQQETLANALNAISNAVAAKATEQTLEQIKTALTDGTQQVQLTGKKVQLACTNYSQPLNVAVGSSTTVTITPPVGELWHIKNLHIHVAALSDASTGDHAILVSVGPPANKMRITRGASKSTDALELLYNYWTTATIVKTPQLENSVIELIQATLVDNANPLVVSYYNNTNSTQAGMLSLILMREVEYINA